MVDMLRSRILRLPAAWHCMPGGYELHTRKDQHHFKWRLLAELKSYRFKQEQAKKRTTLHVGVLGPCSSFCRDAARGHGSVPSRIMPGLVLEFNSRGLLVTGLTYSLRELLKAEGGRWDALLKGWIFPFEGKQPETKHPLNTWHGFLGFCHRMFLARKLLQSLRTGSDGKDVPSIQDNAKVVLTLGACARGLIVTGESFPVKATLKNEGGTWDAKLKGWIFEDQGKAELVKVLRSNPDVGKIEEKFLQGNVAAAKNSVVAWEGGGKGKAEIASPLLSIRLRGKQAASKSQKVVEAGQHVRRTEHRADGSTAETRVDRQQRKTSCKETGTHLQTDSVTRIWALEIPNLNIRHIV
ncbi:unnamed protein product, partial [Polarella glacialis]